MNLPLRATPFAIPFRRPLRIAGEPVTHRFGIVLELGEAGDRGLGEIAPPPAAGSGALFALCRALGAPGPHSRLVAAGLATAALDRRARAARVSVATLLGGTRRARVAVNALLDADAPEALAAQGQALVARGYRCLKLKLAPADIDGDVRRLAALRAAVGDAVALRADANGAWSHGHARDALRHIARFDLEYVEQPVADAAGLAALRRDSPIAFAADESAVDAAAVEHLAALHAADVIVIKPAFLGLHGARAAVAAAQRHGLRVVVTSALDSGIGLAAALQVAALLPEPALACGLATGELLAGDVVETPLCVHSGYLRFSEAPGLGVILDRAALARWQIAAPIDLRCDLDQVAAATDGSAEVRSC